MTIKIPDLEFFNVLVPEAARTELRELSYEEQQKKCGLTTLETKKLRGDQIEVFKIFKWYENINRTRKIIELQDMR